LPGAGGSSNEGGGGRIDGGGVPSVGGNVGKVGRVGVVGSVGSDGKVGCVGAVVGGNVGGRSGSDEPVNTKGGGSSGPFPSMITGGGGMLGKGEATRSGGSVDGFSAGFIWAGVFDSNPSIAPGVFGQYIHPATAAAGTSNINPYFNMS
jgi:hypothetical protein